ncbi:hypothetical protein BX661DRAFT_103007 [Kickxella alabastrina]|uniref:uncharacterized protein n=1 Tax=Kickxella alabastrina TaxID=61397 RepID=UPI00221EF188|nr:uncharacterized protein BX661DRAFT_103007 [Kickxella alabastrina]KAI7818971.1 hypothetical protein BX661DRAFT_103007 [Kickxella alabastrina]
MPAILRDNGQPNFPQQPPFNPSHSFHPGTQSVIISNDNHGMFSHSMSRMNFHRGHARISSESVSMTCPRCKENINTLVKQRPGALHILATAGAMALGLACNAQALLPLAMLPMQLKSLHPAVHYCPICNYKMGKNVRLTVPMV